jgi:N-acetylmuramoyl-L-alanine amidase
MNCPWYRIIVLIGLSLAVILGLSDSPLAMKLTFGEPDIQIVLDPGHGGHDPGGKGPVGTLEKDITLDIAQKIKARCGTNVLFFLTRTGDYHLGTFERTAAANKINADLFISIHTGGSFQHRTNGMVVYYHETTPSQTGNTSPGTVAGSDGADSITRWEGLQESHRQSSRNLAELIKQYLEEKVQIQKVDIQGMPILVLEGAAMPAVLIEVGTITNPADEKMLKDPDFLSSITDAVCTSIDTFLEIKPDN